MDTSFFERRTFGIKNKELLAFFGFYLIFAIFYHFTLYVNRGGYLKDDDVFMNFKSFMDDSGLDYLLKLIITLPIWYLLFKKLKSWPHYKRLLLHLILLPIFVFLWQQAYYLFSDILEYGHLEGRVQIWDIYIPALFYVLQFGVFHSYNYYVENQRKLKLEGELRTSALKSELSALKAQLNPHFLYNIFNTISASVPAENEKTRHLIAELSDLFRYQLKASQTEKVPLREELDFVKKYLALEKERFKERLEINIDVDKDILNEMVPPMILQPLVENSVKHGLSSLIEGGSITIQIKRKEDKLAFVIADTGVGIKNKSAMFSKGIGLTNTKMRLEKMYQTTLNISDNEPRGLRIDFAL